jgi:hypothetical protein
MTWTAADDAVARHPAGRGKAADPHVAPKGPDDDREFLAMLEQAIRRNPPVSLLPRRSAGREEDLHDQDVEPQAGEAGQLM